MHTNASWVLGTAKRGMRGEVAEKEREQTKTDPKAPKKENAKEPPKKDTRAKKEQREDERRTRQEQTDTDLLGDAVREPAEVHATREGDTRYHQHTRQSHFPAQRSHPHGSQCRRHGREAAHGSVPRRALGRGQDRRYEAPVLRGQELHVRFAQYEEGADDVLRQPPRRGSVRRRGGRRQQGVQLADEQSGSAEGRRASQGGFHEGAARPAPFQHRPVPKQE